MRRRVLLRSIDRHLPGGGPSNGGAVLFSTSARGLTVAAGCGVVAGLMASAGGLPGATAVMVGCAVLLLISALTTDARVVADIGDRFALMRASRVRQAAVEFLEWIDEPSTFIEKTGSSFVSSQWRLGDRVFTATKRAEKALEEMLTGRLPGG